MSENNFSIIIVDKITGVYEDMALMIAHTLVRAGKNLTVNIFETVQHYNREQYNIRGFRIYLGHFTSEIQIPPNSVICDFDPLNFDMLTKLSSKTISENKFLCYSDKVINKLKQKHPLIQIEKFRFGYSEFLDINSPRSSQYYGTSFRTCEEHEKQFDVAFLMGNYVYPRRNRLINMLICCGVNVFHDNHTHREKRMELYSKSRIILSVYSKEENLEYSSGSRIFPAVSSGCFVISEQCTDSHENNILQNICINVKYERLVTTVLYYLKNSEERISKARQFYNNIKHLETPLKYLL